LVVELRPGPVDVELAGQPAGLFPPEQVVQVDGRLDLAGDEGMVVRLD
jgi:hypothetical protein